MHTNICTNYFFSLKAHRKRCGQIGSSQCFSQSHDVHPNIFLNVSVCSLFMGCFFLLFFLLVICEGRLCEIPVATYKHNCGCDYTCIQLNCFIINRLEQHIIQYLVLMVHC